ncbi:MAG: UbiA family prenyltransferase [Candidatus Kariarchaeaceae archaeon]|jgi:protoheme IX farnesyltransferase
MEKEIIAKISSLEHVGVSQSFIPFSLYGELIKGKQTFLLCFTGLFAYLASGYPDNLSFLIAISLLIGLFFAVSGSTLFNMYIDRDIDAIMDRTKGRALPSGKIKPKVVLWHGFVFTSFGILLIGVINMLTMFIVFLGFFFDVIVYSLLLKRRTRFSIIFGGVAGGLPALAGRTAAVNEIDLVGLFFLLFVLSWIPLHILTLSLVPENLKGYMDAGVPMWPVVSGKSQTMIVITISTTLSGILMVFIATTIDLHIITQLPLIGLGIYTIVLSLRNLLRPSDRLTFRLFKFASIFMAFTFLWILIARIITTLL